MHNVDAQSTEKKIEEEFINIFIYSIEWTSIMLKMLTGEIEFLLK